MKRHMFAAVAAVAIGAAATAVAGGAQNPRATLDTHWLKQAAQGDMFEVTMGKLALQKGSGTTCTVARMLVTDHTKSLRQTQRVATKAGITLPSRPNPLQDSIVQQLSSASGTSFEQAFSTIGVGAHRLAILEAREIQRLGQLASVRTLAQQELPILRRHLAQMTTLAKGATAAATAAGAAATTTGQTTTTAGQSTAAATTSTGQTTTSQNATGCGSTSSG